VSVMHNSAIFSMLLISLEHNNKRAPLIAVACPVKGGARHSKLPVEGTRLRTPESRVAVPTSGDTF
jgi:hypothetical protein